MIQHNVRGFFFDVCTKVATCKLLKYAAKHFVRVSRFVPTLKTGHSTPAFMIGAGNLDLSVKFPFALEILLLFEFQTLRRNGGSTSVEILAFILAMQTIPREVF